MADLKTTQLTTLAATPATNDLLMIVDVSDTTMAASGTNKKIVASYFVNTDGNDAKVTGGGTVALGGFTATVPATGAVAVMGASNSGAWIHTRGALTIASGAVSAAGVSYATIDTEALSAADDLDTINGGTSGQILILQSLANTRDVTVKNATGNLYLDGSADFVLTATRDKIMLICSGGTEWHELSRSNNT